MRTLPFLLATIVLLSLESASFVWGQAWTGWSDISTVRYFCSSVVLQDGKVLFAGGKTTDNSILSSCEVFNPLTNTSVSSAPMNTARYLAHIVLLKSGKVLVVGGYNTAALSSCELYDPIANTWTPTGSLLTPRYNGTATLLNDGRVLVTGGRRNESLNSCEIYSPATGVWTQVAPLPDRPRNSHTAALLSNGKVLVTDGYYTDGGLQTDCYLFNPVNNTWSATGGFSTYGSGDHVMTALPNGKVLMAGGWPLSLSRCELYDPATGIWKQTALLIHKRTIAGSVLLPNGQVLLAGGYDSKGSDQSEFSLASCEVFDPIQEQWTSTPELPVRVEGHAIHILPDGEVMVAAGGRKDTAAFLDPQSIYKSVYTTSFASPQWLATGDQGSGRVEHTLTHLPGGNVLMAGGRVQCATASASATCEIYDYQSRTWAKAATMQQARRNHTATLLPDGSTLCVGGEDGGTVLGSTEVYNALKNTWTTTTPMSTPRAHHTASLLMNGNLLVTGGKDLTTNALSSVELYNPLTKVWKPIAPMNEARYKHTATLLPNGKILVIGGYSTTKKIELASAEIYDPFCNTWKTITPMITSRSSHTATLLPNGKILVCGGYNTKDKSLRTAEVYDYLTNKWFATDNLMDNSHGRTNHSTITLHNGDLLVTGGFDSLAGDISDCRIYKMASNTWYSTSSLPSAHIYSAALLLGDNTVLLAGGQTSSPCNLPVQSFTYDVGLGYLNADRPTISAISPSEINSVTGSGYFSIEVHGSGFQDRNNRHGSEASSGNFYSSATNYPIVEIKRIGADRYDNDFKRYVSFDAGNFIWSDTATRIRIDRKSAALRDLPSGYYRLSVIANGIPSLPSYFAVKDTSGTTANGSIAIAGKDTICKGASALLAAETGYETYLWSTGETTSSIIVKESGTYTVTAQNSAGCLVSDSKRVFVINTVISIQGADSVCKGESTALVAEQGFQTYKWSTGETTNTIIITQPGTYFVTATSMNGCTATNSKIVRTGVCDTLECRIISGIINDYTAVTGIDIPSKILIVTNASIFSRGDQILIMQMQGANIDTTNTPAYGSVIDFNGAGNYEFATIQNIQANKLILQSPLIHQDYRIEGRIQVVRIPIYDHVTVTGTLTCPPWNGKTGGVLALSANCLMLESGMDVSGKGFRGGEYINQPGCVYPQSEDYSSKEFCRWSFKGEGIAGNGVVPYLLGKGSPANGGGGGNNHNAGGGGGSNYGVGGQGGYGSEGVLGDKEIASGIGGKSLSSIPEKLFMGGGGGSGHANHNHGSGGANGGGIIILQTGNIRNPTEALISAIGMSASDDSSSLNPDGCGGGGAGGAIIIQTQKIDSHLTVNVQGGNGGSIIHAFTTAGPGGGGGGGFVGILDTTQINRIATITHGGKAGTIVTGTRYGATEGAEGKMRTISRLSGIKQTKLPLCRGCTPVLMKEEVMCGRTVLLVSDNGFLLDSLWLDSDKSSNVILLPPALPTSNMQIVLQVSDLYTAGTYVIWVRNSNGKRLSISGKILPLPAVPLISWEGQNLISTSAYSYQWNLEGHPLYNGVHQSYRPIYSGSYTVTITDTNSCSSTSEPFSPIWTDIAEQIGNNTIWKIYPNPAGDFLIIEGPVLSSQKIGIEIRNLLGITVFTSESTNTNGVYKQRISLDKLSQGVYFVVLRDNGKLNNFTLQVIH